MRGADCLQCRLLEGMERGMLGETVQHFFFQKKKKHSQELASTRESNLPRGCWRINSIDSERNVGQVLMKGLLLQISSYKSTLEKPLVLSI